MMISKRDKQQLKELREENEKLKSIIETKSKRVDKQQDEINTLTKKLNGERVCDTYCLVCENSLIQEHECFFMGKSIKEKKYTCLLNCKCSDFSKNETKKVGY